MHIATLILFLFNPGAVALMAIFARDGPSTLSGPMLPAAKASPPPKKDTPAAIAKESAWRLLVSPGCCCCARRPPSVPLRAAVEAELIPASMHTPIFLAGKPGTNPLANAAPPAPVKPTTSATIPHATRPPTNNFVEAIWGHRHRVTRSRGKWDVQVGPRNGPGVVILYTVWDSSRCPGWGGMMPFHASCPCWCFCP